MKKKTKRQPKISTASLPDIIFILLFFFMVVTVLRKNESSLFVHLPEVTKANEFKPNRLTAYVYVGKNHQKDNEVNIQINDQYVSLNKSDVVFTQIKSQNNNHDDVIEIKLKADKGTPMQTINKIKRSLRKANLRNLQYLTD